MPIRRRRGERDAVARVDDVLTAAQENGFGAPTVDTGLVRPTPAFGFPEDAAVTVLAVGPMAGWIAHTIEERRQGFPLRPGACNGEREAATGVLPSLRSWQFVPGT
jgi:citrate synthase